MSLQRAFYPHALNFYDGGEAVVQLDDVTPAMNDTYLSESCASGYAPEFLGIQFSAPDIRFTTAQLKDILDRFTDGNIAESFTAGQVDVEYRAGKPEGTREPLNAGLHVVGRMLFSAFMTFESMSARQSQMATMQAMLTTAWDPTNPEPNDPLIFYNRENLLTQCQVRSLYTMGPTFLNGNPLTGVTDVQWNNNITLEQIPADGDHYNSYVGIRETRPEVRIRSNNIELMSSLVNGQLESEGLVVYLRQYKRGEFFFPDNQAVHIKMSAMNGHVRAQQIQNSAAEVEILVRLGLQANENFFDLDTTSDIP